MEIQGSTNLTETLQHLTMNIGIGKILMAYTTHFQDNQEEKQENYQGILRKLKVWKTLDM